MIQWGLAGLGDISRKRVAPAIRSQSDSILSAVHSPFEAELRKFQSDFIVEKAYLCYEDMLSDPDVHAVYIATPIHLHAGLALKAIESGKHVLVEKPMAMKNAECEAMIAAAHRNGVKLGVSYYRRFFPKLIEAKRLINEGAIGDVVGARIYFHSWYNPAPDDPKYWRVIKMKGGGGPLWDIGCHKIDQMMDLLGDVKSVCAYMRTLTHDYEVEDSCSAILEFTSGVCCEMGFRWNCKTWADEFVVLGTDGKIDMTPGDSDIIELELPPGRMRGMGKELTTVSKPPASNVHAPLVDDFAKAVIENREPRINGEAGYRVNSVLAAIEESSVTGNRIII